MERISKIVEPLLLTTGVAYGLNNIQTILGVVIMVLQLGWLLAKLVIKIIDTIKSRGKLDDIKPDLDEVIDKLDEIKERYHHGEGVSEDGDEE